MGTLSCARGLLHSSANAGCAPGEYPKEDCEVPCSDQWACTRPADQLDLIVYYARAILYNTPYDTPEFGIRDVAEAVSLGLAGDPGCFDKIFLFVPIEKENKVFQLWPLLR